MDLFVSYRSELDDGFRKHGAKLATLWFDRIYFDPIRTDLVDRHYDALFSYEELDSAARAALTDVWRPASEIAPRLFGSRAILRRDENWMRRDEQYSPGWDAVIAHHERRLGVEKLEGQDLYYGDGDAKSAVNNVALWFELNSRSMCRNRPTNPILS